MSKKAADQNINAENQNSNISVESPLKIPFPPFESVDTTYTDTFFVSPFTPLGSIELTPMPSLPEAPILETKTGDRDELLTMEPFLPGYRNQDQEQAFSEQLLNSARVIPTPPKMKTRSYKRKATDCATETTTLPQKVPLPIHTDVVQAGGSPFVFRVVGINMTKDTKVYYATSSKPMFQGIPKFEDRFKLHNGEEVLDNSVIYVATCTLPTRFASELIVSDVFGELYGNAGYATVTINDVLMSADVIAEHTGATVIHRNRGNGKGYKGKRRSWINGYYETVYTFESYAKLKDAVQRSYEHKFPG
jgi:hypothetical protein